MTSVLSLLKKESLQEWRNNVGESVANWEMGRAARGGKAMHTLVEQYLQNLTDTPEILTKSDPIQPEIPQLPKTLEVFPEISMAPDNSKEILHIS